MRALSSFVVLLALFASPASGNASPRLSDTQLMTAVDSMCRWAQLSRVGQLRDIHCYPTDDVMPAHCAVTVRLFAEGTRRSVREYTVNVENDLSVRFFSLEHWPFPDEYPRAGTGANTVRDSALRHRLISAAERANRHLNYACVGSALIQSAGDSYVVTYRQITKSAQHHQEKLENAVILHPYVSFLVTSRGSGPRRRGLGRCRDQRI